MAAPDKLLYSRTALWDSRTTDACLFNLAQQQNATGSTGASDAGATCEPVSSFSSAAADSGYMSSSSLHTASMISDLVNKLVDSEDDQMPPPLPSQLPELQQRRQQQQQHPSLLMQSHHQQPQLQPSVDQKSPRPLVRMQQPQLPPQHHLHQTVTHQPGQQPLQLQHCVTSAASMQQQGWMALQACQLEGIQSARADAAIKSAAAAAAAAVARLPVAHHHQHQLSRAQQHPHALILPAGSNYILLPQAHRPQFLQLAPRALHAQTQSQQLVHHNLPSLSQVSSAPGNLVAMETGQTGSPGGARQASMTRRATHTDSERSARLAELAELRRLLSRELRQAEARVAAAWQAMRSSGTASPGATAASAAASSGNPSASSPAQQPPQHGAIGIQEDRELQAVSQELSRLQQLVQRAERLRNSALPAGVHSALDRLSEALRKCQTRRKEEVTGQNNRGSGGRTVEERDSRAVSAAVGELLEQLQAARTCLWAALQMALAGFNEEVEGLDASVDSDGDGGVEARVFRRLEARRQQLAELRADPYDD